MAIPTTFVDSIDTRYAVQKGKNVFSWSKNQIDAMHNERRDVVAKFGAYKRKYLGART